MGDPTEFPLRPLGIGEIFDRAVTIYVRHFAVFTTIIMTMLVPFGVLRYYVFGKQLGLESILQNPTAKQPPMPPEQVMGMLGGFAVIALVALLIAPVVNNAIAIGVANLYSGHPVTYGQCFRTALARWGSLVGATLLVALVLIGVYFGVVIVLVVVIGIGSAFVNSALPLAVIFYIVAGLGFLAFLLFLLVMIVAASFALYSTSIENLGPVTAVSKAFGRIFNRGEIRKAFLMALAFFGLELGVGFLSAGVSMVLEFVVKNYALAVGAETIISGLLSSFVAILLAVYYYDVRTRAEGLDLEVDLARLTA